MGPAVVSYRFQRPPSAFRYFPRAVLGRRSALVPAGQGVPRLEGSAERVRASARHLERYLAICGFGGGGLLPVTYPHLLAMPLHFAILTHPRFPVRLMGLVHVGNEINQARPLPVDRDFALRTWIEGFREGDRGHEFDLFTALEDGGGTAWHEKSTLLARRPSTAKQAARSARRALRFERPAGNDSPAQVDIDVSRVVGRRYGWLSGDLNPIHLGDLGARIFGFERAVAHGMWSMARTLAALGNRPLVPPVQVRVEFKLPLYLPAVARLEHWQHDGRRVFVLKNAASDRPHLAGSTCRG
jgi:MaoC like domain